MGLTGDKMEAAINFGSCAAVCVMATKSWPALKSCQTSCQNKQCKARRIGEENDDLLSELPQEILLSIISSFTMKEVAKFSLVSRRCEVIRRYVPVLIFEDHQAMERISKSLLVIVEERPVFLKRVDRVLEKHLGTIIDELGITFDLDRSSQTHVDKWVTFALDKEVKRFELNFKSNWRGAFHMCNGVKLPVCDECLDLPPKFTGFKSFLTSLCLRYVNVTDEFVDCLSHSCPFLEILCIEGSRCLTRVSGSLTVKHLEVSWCLKMEIIDISAPKLHSLTLYVYPIIELRIVDALSLSELRINMAQGLPYAVNSLSKYFSQLIYLNVTIPVGTKINGLDYVVTMPNLQHLELEVELFMYPYLFGWASLIEASPNLQKMTLKVKHCRTKFGRGDDERLFKWYGYFPLKCLKTLELVGYVGYPMDLEVVFFVLENASMLEEIVVNFAPSTENDIRDRLRAMLQLKLPQHVTLTLK